MNINISKDNQFYLDRGLSSFVKLICSLLILLHHYSQYAVAELGVTNILTKVVSSQGGYLAVAFFFFLSGYGITKSCRKKKEKFSTYITRRLSKIYLPALSITVLWILTLWFLNLSELHITAGRTLIIPSLFNAICSSFCLQFYDPVLWYVKVVLLLYIIAYFLNVFRPQNNWMNFALTLIVSCVSVFLTRIIIDPFASASVFSFFLGLYVANIERGFCKIFYIQITCLCVIPLLLVSDIGMEMHGLISAMVLLSVLILLSKYRICMARTYSNLGDISYDIYLVHNKALMLLYIYSCLNICNLVLCTLVLSLIMFFLRKCIKL